MLKATDERAPTFRWLLDRLLHEATTARPGAGLAADNLAHLLFVETLRACLTEAGSLPVGWLRAIADERIAPSLRLMHDQPGRAALDYWGRESIAVSALAALWKGRARPSEKLQSTPDPYLAAACASLSSGRPASAPARFARSAR